jgi:hypothetical protein
MRWNEAVMTRRVLSIVLVLSAVAVALLLRADERAGRPSDVGVEARTPKNSRESSTGAPQSPPLQSVRGAQLPAMSGTVSRVRAFDEEPVSARAGLAVLEILVVAAETGAPVEDVLVELEQWVVTVGNRPVTIGESDADEKPEDVHFTFDERDSTDREGRGAFGELEPGDYQLFIGRGQRAESVRLSILRLEAGEQRTVTVPLLTNRGRPYDAVVVDSLSGEPVASAWVELPDPNEFHEAPATRVVADEDGRLSCELPMWLDVWARIGGPEHATRLVRLAGDPMSDAPARLTLDPLAELEITVLDERGQTAHGIAVRLETRRNFESGGLSGPRIELPAQLWLGTTDHEGRAAFSGLPPREDLFASLAPGRQVLRPIVIVPGERARTTLHMRETSIIGVARDRTGLPVAELRVWLVRADAPIEPGASRTFADSDRTSAYATSTDRSGRFSFVDVLPGTWWIGPAPAGDSSRHDFVGKAVAVEMQPEDVAREVALTVEGER